MRAIIETGGMQFPVEDQQVIEIPRLNAEIGSKIDFDKVLLISGPEKFAVGKPYIPGARVSVEIVAQNKGDKIIVSKFKKRRKYRRYNGHRQAFTKVKILSISA